MISSGDSRGPERKRVIIAGGKKEGYMLCSHVRMCTLIRGN